MKMKMKTTVLEVSYFATHHFPSPSLEAEAQFRSLDCLIEHYAEAQQLGCGVNYVVVIEDTGYKLEIKQFTANEINEMIEEYNDESFDEHSTMNKTDQGV